MATLGDKNQTTALHAFNAKSLWTHELEALLLEGKLDLIVHSLKDMPTQLPGGCCLGSVLERGDRRDVVVMNAALAARGVRGLGQLGKGAVVGTSSVRRSAQVKRTWPALVCRDVRGNVGTRLRKLDEEEENGYSCLILAAAGVQRLGLGGRISAFLSGREGGMLGAVGQGALGVECREGDERVGRLLEGVGDERSWREGVAERSLLRTLEGGCSVPIGVETEWEYEGGEGEEEGKGERKGDGNSDGKGDILVMRAIVVSVDGTEAVEGERRQRVTNLQEADECGWKMAQELVEKGAGKILEKITLNRAVIEKQDGA